MGEFNNSCAEWKKTISALRGAKDRTSEHANLKLRLQCNFDKMVQHLLDENWDKHDMKAYEEMKLLDSEY